MRNFVDGFTLPEVSMVVLQNTLERILALHETGELAACGRRGRLAAGARFTGEAIFPRISHLLSILKFPRKKKAGPKIGLFIQMHDPNRFHQLRQCIYNTLEAAGTGRVDIFITTTKPLEELRYAEERIMAQKMPALGFIVASQTVNRGADIGMFLHQLLLAQELSFNHDVILKLHSKGLKHWRELLVGQLCGSVEVVTNVLSKFRKDQKLGLIGPSNLTWTKKGSLDHVAFNLAPCGFNDLAVEQFRTAWSMLGHTELPPEEHWTIVAGSFYWTRANLTSWNLNVLPQIPRLLDVMGTYTTGCNDVGCQAALGLERVMPTLVSMSGKVSTVPFAIN